jgi:hypothetical protein
VERKICFEKKGALSSSKVHAALKKQTAGRSAKSYRIARLSSQQRLCCGWLSVKILGVLEKEGNNYRPKDGRCLMAKIKKKSRSPLNLREFVRS